MVLHICHLAFEGLGQKGLKPLSLLCVHLLTVFPLNYRVQKKNSTKKNKHPLSFLRKKCKSCGCAQAFICLSTLSGGTLAGNKSVQSLQTDLAEKKTEKASERNVLPHYAFLMPVSLFPLLMPFTPFHHFPLGSDKEELALVTLFSTPSRVTWALLSHPLFLSHVSLSFHPSFLCSLSSLPMFLSPFPLFIWPFFPSFHPHSSVWSTVLSPAQHSCSWPVTGQKKADIQLCMSYYSRLM